VIYVRDDGNVSDVGVTLCLQLTIFSRAAPPRTLS
jgi:hypothetical protein